MIMLKKITRLVNKKLFWTIFKYKPIFMPFPPNNITLDPSTYCCLNCPTCSTGTGRKGLSKGNLKFNDFKKFIDKYDYFISYLFLSNWGEIFLNPEVIKIIKYARQKDIYVNSDTNLNYFSDQMAENLVKSGMNELYISIDGASNETYIRHRKGGDFNKVISHIRMINKYKKLYKTENPKLVWKFIIFKHNKHEINMARKMAEELNMSFRLDSNCFIEQSGLSTDCSVGDDIFLQVPGITKEKLYNIDTNFCHQIWDQPVINYNGNMLGCCIIFDEKYHLGNVFEDGFFKVYNGKKMKELRKMVLGKTTRDANIFCLRCIFKNDDNEMLSIDQRINIFKLLKQTIDKNTEGEVVDLGCYDGLNSILIQHILDEYHCKKELHVYDSFQGLPYKSKEDADTEYDKGWCKISKDQLIDNFNFYHIKLPIIHAGWFKDILPEELPPKISFVHIDGDLYHSIKVSLKAVYSRLSKGAVVVIDDYYDDKVHVGKNILPGVKEACDEFFKDKNENVIPLIAGNKAHAYFIKK